MKIFTETASRNNLSKYMNDKRLIKTIRLYVRETNDEIKGNILHEVAASPG